MESQVALEDPKRFRIEMTFSRGADLSPLEVNSVEQKGKILIYMCSLIIKEAVYSRCIKQCNWIEKIT